MNMRELLDMPWFCFTPSIACNIKCSYCSQSDVRTNTISTDLLQDKTLLDFISYIPPTHLFISGGEPLILPGMREFVNFASGYGHKISFDTNLCIPLKKLEDYLSFWSPESMCYWNISHNMVCDIKLEYINGKSEFLGAESVVEFINREIIQKGHELTNYRKFQEVEKFLARRDKVNYYKNHAAEKKEGNMNIIRKIELECINDFKKYSEWQDLYMDSSTGRLIPNTEIWASGERIIRINSLGCKGNELESGIPVVGFFGDSATFGASFSVDSWPQHLNIRGCQPLNAAVEGYNLDRVLERYKELNKIVNFACVVGYTGWHNIIYGESSEDYWRSKLDILAGEHVLAFCTLATCLTDECKQKGIESLLCTDSPRKDYANYFEYNLESLNRRYFNFWCNMEPSLENIRKVVDGVRKYNDFLRRYCLERGYILIDLHSFMLPESYEEIPNDFYDVCHPRPSAYEKIGRYIGRVIDEPLKNLLQIRTDKFFIDPVNPVSHPGSFGIARKDKTISCNYRGDDEDLRKNIYPLW
ncbi:MAG: hypothetical protein HZB61_10565 [Nitrospirae bacterium]|nr:hypothetical protein [Nitrospirota bacterium]